MTRGSSLQWNSRSSDCSPCEIPMYCIADNEPNVEDLFIPVKSFRRLLKILNRNNEIVGDLHFFSMVE